MSRAKFALQHIFQGTLLWFGSPSHGPVGWSVKNRGRLPHKMKWNLKVTCLTLWNHTQTHFNESYLIQILTQGKMRQACQIVCFYCLIVYYLSRIQYNLSSVSMLLKFVDWTTIWLTYCFRAGQLIKISAADFYQIFSDPCYSIGPRKRLHLQLQYVHMVNINRGHTGHIGAFHTVDTETDCAKGQGGYF